MTAESKNAGADPRESSATLAAPSRVTEELNTAAGVTTVKTPAEVAPSRNALPTKLLIAPAIVSVAELVTPANVTDETKSPPSSKGGSARSKSTAL